MSLPVALQYEGGEPCSVCGHRLSDTDAASQKASAYPSNIIPQFLYLGSYDNASRSELLKTVGITHILNVRLAKSPDKQSWLYSVILYLILYH